MAVRKIVRIDEELCDGCGLCVPSCAEGALRVVDGKARLVSEVYCDGLSACLGECPQGAISMEEREAPDFDEEAVHAHLARQQEPVEQPDLPCGCPGSAVQTLSENVIPMVPRGAPPMSTLGHWPVQLSLVPAGAPFLKGAHLLICADCVPFTVPDFHSRYLEGKALLVGCPKLDNLDFYRHKLAQIFAQADPASLTVLRMEVPCCGGIAEAVVEARDRAVPHLPVEIVTLGIRGGAHREVLPAPDRKSQRSSG